MQASSDAHCSSDKPRVFFSAVINERGGIGLRGTPVTGDRLGSDAQRYIDDTAAIRRLNVRGFISPASTCSRSWDTQS